MVKACHFHLCHLVIRQLTALKCVCIHLKRILKKKKKKKTQGTRINEFTLYLWVIATFLSLYQDISHCFDFSGPVICAGCSLIPTGIGVIRGSSCAKPDSGITASAVVFLVSNETNSCFRSYDVSTHSVEAFSVTIELYRSLRTNQRLPRDTTQLGGTVFPVGDQ